MTALDKERYVADWTAKHSPESAASAAARRRLPSAPSKDEVTDDSLREVEKILARSELNNQGTNSSTTMTTSNIRPSYKPSLKPLIDNTGTTSYRSLPYSTNYTSASSGHTTRLGGHQESAAARASIRRKPLSGTSSYLMSSAVTSGKSYHLQNWTKLWYECIWMFMSACIGMMTLVHLYGLEKCDSNLLVILFIIHGVGSCMTQSIIIATWFPCTTYKLPSTESVVW